jgi:hypothetical protein
MTDNTNANIATADTGFLNTVLHTFLNDILDTIFMFIKRDVIDELKATEMHGEDERISTIKSIKRLYEMNLEFFPKLDAFLRNELITFGFGPGNVFKPFVDGLKDGLSWQDLCELKPPYSRCGWGTGNTYNMRDLDQILSKVDRFHPDIPING